MNRVYIMPPLGPPPPLQKVELKAGDWTLIGYTDDIKLDTKREYEDMEIDMLQSYKTLWNEKTTLSFDLKRVDNKMFELLMGKTLPPSGVERLKALLK